MEGVEEKVRRIVKVGGSKYVSIPNFWAEVGEKVLVIVYPDKLVLKKVKEER